MNWRELVADAAGPDADVQFRDPATPEQLERVETDLGIVLPSSLTELLLESNGIRCGIEIFSTQQLIEENRSMRTTPDFRDLYWPFDDIVFFAAEGNGDLFGFKAIGGNAEKWCFSVFEWDHETDSRTYVGGHLHSFLDQWLRQARIGRGR